MSEFERLAHRYFSGDLTTRDEKESAQVRLVEMATNRKLSAEDKNYVLFSSEDPDMPVIIREVISPCTEPHVADRPSLSPCTKTHVEDQPPAVCTRLHVDDAGAGRTHPHVYKGPVKAPPFTREAIGSFFHQLDNELALKDVTTENDKLRHLSQAIGPELNVQYAHDFTNPGNPYPYTALKAKLIRRFELSAFQKQRKLNEFKTLPLGVAPSTWLLQMGVFASVEEQRTESFRHRFRMGLPAAVTNVLAAQQFPSFEEYVTAADKVLENQAAHQTPTSDLNAIQRGNGRATRAPRTQATRNSNAVRDKLKAEKGYCNPCATWGDAAVNCHGETCKRFQAQQGQGNGTASRP